MKHMIQSEYIINEHTMAILPFYSETGELHSKVIEKYKVLIVTKSPKVITNDSCMFYGSDMLGRRKSASSILIAKKMLPIMISETHKLCMVPLSSPNQPKCVWVAYQHALDLSSEKDQTFILFPNQKKVKVGVTRKTLSRKFDIAGRLVSTYDIRRQRISTLNQKETVAEEPEIYKIDDEKFND